MASANPTVKVGIIGAGNISPAYIKGCAAFEILDLVAIADLDMPKAQTAAEQFNIPHVLSVEALLADPEIQAVVNLTIPRAHAEVSLSILNAGKHAYSEKPLAVTREDGRRILETAKARNLRVGCAPDTFLFAAHQTCRKIIDEGAIGVPVAAVANMGSHGPENWHPNPDFYYQPGAGPMFDMGPYYITALVNFMGAVSRVSASARASFEERIAGGKNAGRRIPVLVPTHYAGELDFASGAIASVLVSFDLWKHNLPMMEIYGTEGSLSVPDPNGFGHVIRLSQAGKDWEDIPLTHNEEWARGIGLADMAYGITYGRPHRASGELAYHVLDVMHAFEDASISSSAVKIESTVERPARLPIGLEKGVLDVN